MTDSVAGYERKASELADLYESLSFEDCHVDAFDLIPERPGLVLDVGAGSGRDAAWFAGRGWDVVAVEPVEGMRREGQQRHPQAPIRWLSDRLPGLEAVHRLGLMFELIWLSAVWMHVTPPERQRAFRKLVTLLKPGGRMVLTLRHGPAPPDRPMHETSAAEMKRLGLDFGLVTMSIRERPDRLGRSLWRVFLPGRLSRSLAIAMSVSPRASSSSR